MPPAKRKDSHRGARTRKRSSAEDSWQSEIENLSLNEEGWKCVIAMVVETRPEHARYLDLFNEAADEGTRDAIFSLSYEKLIRGVKFFGKSDPRQGICQFAGKKIEEEGEAALPPRVICGLVKFFINRAKTRSLEVLGSRARIGKGIAEEIESLGISRGETAAKSKGGSGDVKSFDKANARVRKRGDEWRDRTRVDDAPAAGPNLYVVLTGFRDPNLATEFLDAGLPLAAIFRVLRPGEEPDASHAELSAFWSSLETTLRDPGAASRYSEVVLQTFCPPEINGSDLEAAKADAYRRISFLVYDLCDLRRWHGTYIRMMKLQSGLDEERPAIQATETYDAVMRAFPEECASVAVVLDALLSQVDGSKIREAAFDREGKDPETFAERSRSRVDRLNNEFDVFGVAETDAPGSPDPRLILHGDDLGLKTRHCSPALRPTLSTIAPDFGTRVLRQSAASLIWKNLPNLTDERMKIHEHHIRRISECSDPGIDDLTTGHYLHLLLFGKLMSRKDPRGNLLGGEPPSPGRGAGLRPKPGAERTKSEALEPVEYLAKSSPGRFASDSAIEYGKEIAGTFECPEIFGLVDAREMLRPGYLDSPESFPARNPGAFDPEEFDTVELLSPDVFPQVFFSCYRGFRAFETRYFAPTDSTLVIFRDKRPGEPTSEREYSASIPTPVCLRDFARFVIDEEKHWLGKEDEEREAPGRSRTREDADGSPLPGSYTDADFVLPNSIKGAERTRGKAIGGTEAAMLTSREELAARVKGRPGGGRESNPGKSEIKGGKAINPVRREESLEANGSFPPLEEEASVRSSGDAEPGLLGYGIADHRVQVSGFASDFVSDDGTGVKVNREEWSCGRAGLRVRIELLGNELVTHSADADEYVTFHLATSNGIFMGFSLPSRSKEAGSRDPKGNHQDGETRRGSDAPGGTPRPETAVDPGFRASWPSGLVVETLPGDGPSEPFYIKQSYLSKGPQCNGISSETGRVFLRDGSVVVFAEDGGARLMLSNGRVVTCRDFATEDKKRGGEEGDEALAAEDSRLKSSRNSKGYKGVNTNEGVPGLGKGSRNLRPLKIGRSVVLEPDGRRFEIYDGEMTREFDRELVRTASDYEVGERFTRRSDGTDTLINSDGFLAVCFPDGSRITTGYAIEEEPVFCEWTEEEFRRFYPASNAEARSRESVLEEEGFVSIFTTSCTEHKNYAAVGYDRSKIACSLSMPGDVGVHFSSDGVFGVDVGSAASLKVKGNGVVFTGSMGGSRGGTSSSVFNLADLSTTLTTAVPFLETTDSFGNVFRVDFDGETSYEKSCPSEEGSEALPTGQNNLSQPGARGYRLFAVKRDLSAYEHLHRSDRQAQENDRAASVFFRRVRGEPGQSLCTSLTSPNRITESEAWLQPYRVKVFRPTNEDRRDLLRSTYSIPWNYMIPYGKNGRGVGDRGWSLPLKGPPGFSAPEALIARTTQTIKDRDENAMKRFQGALGCYWEKSINNFLEYRGSVARKSASREEERDAEDWPRDFAPGGKKTFDKASHLDGPFESRDTRRPGSRISKIRTSGRGDESDREEIERYKACLRDRAVPSYFQDIPGACFTWVSECVDRVGQAAEKEKEE